MMFPSFTVPGLLAQSDWGWLMPVLQIVLSAVLALCQLWLANKLREQERLREELKARTEQVIEQRFALIRGEFDALIARMEERLKHGDRHFEAIDTSLRSWHVEMGDKIDSIKDAMHAVLATREDMRQAEDRLTKRCDELAGRLRVVESGAAARN